MKQQKQKQKQQKAMWKCYQKYPFVFLFAVVGIISSTATKAAAQQTMAPVVVAVTPSTNTPSTASALPPMPPNPGFPPCEVCGPGQRVTFVNNTITIPGQSNVVTCQLYEQLGLLGFVPPLQCPTLAAVVLPCGCAPIMTNNNTNAPTTPTPITTNAPTTPPSPTMMMMMTPTVAPAPTSTATIVRSLTVLSHLVVLVGYIML